MGTYPNDTYQREYWPQGYGQLSFVSGLLLTLMIYIMYEIIDCEVSVIFCVSS